jgi:NhaP-type Na+/H+ or K+/H+ antiporter
MFLRFPVFHLDWVMADGGAGPTIAARRVLSTDDILTGLGLVIVLAIACQLLAVRLRIPAIVLLLPAGFVAGAITDDVDPTALFGATFQPLVSLGVGLILFEAGLRLRFDELQAGTRAVVLRLISIGVLITLVGVTLAAKLIFGLDWGVAFVLGAILVVSGPTVVLPLLAFVRPSRLCRSVLKWEGTLIDPIGALLGVVAFTAVKAGAGGGKPFHPGELAGGIAVGIAVGVLATGALWALLRALQRTAPRQAIPAALMCVAAALVGADLIREDAGFVATTTMGIAMANQRRMDVSRILEFHGTIVSLLIGILFILISASVSPSQVSSVLPESLALIAVMVLLLRPLDVAVATWRSQLTWRERGFIAWMAPRGIVAAATASAFALELAAAGIPQADQLLPISFVVIFGTVVLYGLSAAPVARWLGIAGAGAPTILVVGGDRLARAISRALKVAGIGVRIWTGRQAEQEAAREAGLDAGSSRLGVDVQTREAELEEVSQVLLLTESDDFNALAAFELRQELGSGRVYRLAPARGSLELVPAYAEGGLLFGEGLTHAELTRRVEAGARIVELGPDELRDGINDEVVPLFALTGDGGLRIVTADTGFEPDGAERAICLAPPSPAWTGRLRSRAERSA